MTSKVVEDWIPRLAFELTHDAPVALLDGTSVTEQTLESKDIEGQRASVVEFAVLFYGRTGVGKTCIASHLCNHEILSHVETSGVQVRQILWPVKLFDGRIILVKYRIWDVGAQASVKYEYLLEGALAKCNGAVFFFSVVDRLSFEEIESLINSVSAKAKIDVRILAATKADQYTQRQVTDREMNELSTQLNIPLAKISSGSLFASSRSGAISEDVAALLNLLTDQLLSTS
mmetsp:Transcript_41569/g.69288  ORF Transcript_41569/g.69288 Transcript_41569/m.69288 type:complete len:231 (+) Transcript_41569:86-778(+)|eukprot:CAMPEP_0184349396 /NCGR_PEP_ID=MMETSP1089-20130417/32370_1 /TAXON_ID=38269 ORGANISM="Gloeochaete wittrockiana, Strain SAG46.84" /NCGR_SAMPLE_ID=MMETSP1089 /ASSEMBLY_ACC=CAM_ASM_000445 /LENGTH=230 /DNA_ID=CAMNT_0026681561 /DNA_START=91 /DNA_END=783 /DNA_ORIENTATION=+